MQFADWRSEGDDRFYAIYRRRETRNPPCQAAWSHDGCPLRDEHWGFSKRAKDRQDIARSERNGPGIAFAGGVSGGSKAILRSQ